MTCSASAVPTLVRAEGVTERMGDILLQCSGGTAGTVVSGNLSVFLPVSITNRVDANSVAAQTALVVEAGTAPAAAFTGRVANQSISFNGIQFTVPADGQARLRISNLRGNASQLGTAGEPRIEAFIASTLSSTALANNPVVVARAARGLSATLAPSGMAVARSPLPEEPGVAAFFAAGTRFTSTRFTEAFPEAFEAKDPFSDSGTRFIVRYTGVPADARLFVPDVVAGSDAATPTAGGDLGGTQAAGRHEAGSGALLLARVLSTDANGAGGSPVFTPGPAGSGTVAFDRAREVPLINGAGFVVYEVMDANPARLQSAQFPTFAAAPPTCVGGVVAQTVTFAPVSAAPAASIQAPIPRFAAIEPPSDCSALGDCGSSFFPRLRVNAVNLAFTAPAGGAASGQPGYIAINNTSGGLMAWTAGVAYKNGSGWLTLDPASGYNNRSIFARASARGLAPGTYEATVTIDAGPLTGSVNLPVTLTVTDAATPPQPPQPPPAGTVPSISFVTNAANFLNTPVVPGSLATILGSNLHGASVAVTFDGTAAALLHTSAGQINIQVPAGLAGKTSAVVVVTVDGASSAPATVRLAASAPAIFGNGILNQDNGVNAPGTPAAPGSVVQVFLTGLAAPNRWFDAAVTVKIHDRENLPPLYAGPAPGLEGVQQVNVAVPAGLPAMTTDLVVCAAGSCSHPARITLGQ